MDEGTLTSRLHIRRGFYGICVLVLLVVVMLFAFSFQSPRAFLLYDRNGYLIDLLLEDGQLRLKGRYEGITRTIGETVNLRLLGVVWTKDFWSLRVSVGGLAILLTACLMVKIWIDRRSAIAQRGFDLSSKCDRG